MFNKEQKNAINSTEGQVMVISCAGSGKTTVIINRIKAILDKNVKPESILVITFTKDAAEEMKKRFQKSFGDINVTFGTIHSLCFQILKNEYNLSNDNIITSTEQWEFFKKEILGKISKNDMEEFIPSMISEISYIRNKNLDCEKYNPEVCTKELFMKCFNDYDNFKKSSKKIDFDDMLILCRRLLLKNEDVLKKYKKMFQYIMIDEFQDTNQIQADIFYLMAGENGNICIVGDDDQSIYGFRSADSKIMLDFPNKYPNCKKIYLDTNYRCSSDIIKKAANVIKNNNNRFDKDFKAYRKEKGTINIISSNNKFDEVGYISKKINELHNKGVSYDDIAILYRTNFENKLISGALMVNKIPFHAKEKIKCYYEDFIFQDLLAYYRLANGIQKIGDIQRILNRPNRYLKTNIFKDCNNVNDCLSFVTDLPKAARNNAYCKLYDLNKDLNNLRSKKEPKDFFDYLLYIMGYDRAIAEYTKFCMKNLDSVKSDLEILKTEASKFHSFDKWEKYSKFYIQNLKDKKNQKDGVTLSTFHGSKGLEWKVVFIINLNEGTIPINKAISIDDIEEERRLFYVAMTRAKDNLYILYDMTKSESRFLKETKIKIPV